MFPFGKVQNSISTFSASGCKQWWERKCGPFPKACMVTASFCPWGLQPATFSPFFAGIWEKWHLE